jgi:hypothetical protein
VTLKGAEGARDSRPARRRGPVWEEPSALGTVTGASVPPSVLSNRPVWASWRFLDPENLGTFFITSTPAGEVFPNRYQVLDQLVCTRGLLKQTGLRLDPGSVDIYCSPSVATASGRPRPFNRTTLKGTSDHLPVVASLEY